MEDEIAAWLRKQAEADKAAAEALIGDGWTGMWRIDRYGAVHDCGFGEELLKGVVHDRASWRSVDVAKVRRAQAEAAHVKIHEPAGEVARAESVLAVLDDYETAWKLAEAAWEQEDEAAHSLGDQARTLKRTVRRLAYGYRHREGYKEAEWKP